MSLGKKLLLAVAGIAAVMGPITVGVMNMPRAQAQQTAAVPLSFEVASIRRSRSGEARTSMMPFPEGRLMVENNTLKQLIRSAYGVKDVQLSGGPSWLEIDRYDITAKAEGKASREQLMRMLQTLLADRFKLTFHREMKQLPVYNLVVVKSGKLGPNLHAPKQDASREPRLYPILGAAGRVNGQGATMIELAAYLSGPAGLGFTGDDRLVLDKTGLADTYDFTLEWTPDSTRPRLLPPGGTARHT